MLSKIFYNNLSQLTGFPTAFWGAFGIFWSYNMEPLFMEGDAFFLNLVLHEASAFIGATPVAHIWFFKGL